MEMKVIKKKLFEKLLLFLIFQKKIREDFCLFVKNEDHN